MKLHSLSCIREISWEKMHGWAILAVTCYVSHPGDILLIHKQV